MHTATYERDSSMPMDRGLMFSFYKNNVIYIETNIPKENICFYQSQTILRVSVAFI